MANSNVRHTKSKKEAPTEIKPIVRAAKSHDKSLKEKCLTEDGSTQAPADNSSLTSNSKQSILITLMQRSQGASIGELVTATNWQAHSLRGVISGVVKKRLGYCVISDNEERGRVYRITGMVGTDAAV